MSYSLFQSKEEGEGAKPRSPIVFESTIRYWFGLDSHVYAMAIAANVLFGFFPFMLLLLSLGSFIFPSGEAERAVLLGLRAFLPEDPGLVDFVVRNLQVAVANRGSVQVVSMVLLLVASNGIFMPLEVAQNRLWRFPANRNYLLNQTLSFCIAATSMLAALAAALFASQVGPLLYRYASGTFTTPDIATLWALKTAETLALTLVLFLVYWALPNGPVEGKRAFTTAILVAVLIEVGQVLYAWIWPWLDLRGEYGPFFISVTLMLWGFLAAMVVLAGAEGCARSSASSRA